jgi:hypothetical protein
MCTGVTVGMILCLYRIILKGLPVCTVGGLQPWQQVSETKGRQRRTPQLGDDVRCDGLQVLVEQARPFQLDVARHKAVRRRRLALVQQPAACDTVAACILLAWQEQDE